MVRPRSAARRGRRGLACALACVLAAAPGAPRAQPGCGPIPGTYALSTGTELEIKKDVAINANPVAEGKTSPDAVLAGDGTVSPIAQTLPPIVPAAFPPNGSSTKADEGDAPFVATSDRYWKEIEIGKNATAAFTGGGPFHIGKLEVKDGATVELAAGVYYVDELKMKKGSTLLVTSPDVVVHVAGKFEPEGKNVTVNPGGAVTDLQVLLHPGAEMKGGEGLDFTGLVYGPAADEVELKKDTSFHGAVLTGGKVEVGKDTTLTYTAADAAAVGALSTCPGTADHFAVVHDGSAVNCLAEPVAIEVHAADESLEAGYAGTVTVTSTTGNGQWSLVSGAGVFTATGPGSATYAFDPADGGRVDLALYDPVAETVGVDVSDGALAESAAEDPALVFAAAGFVFRGGAPGGLVGTQIAGKPSGTAPAEALSLLAVRTDTQTGACEAALTGAVAVDLAYECVDPGVCAAPALVVGGVPVPPNPAGAVTAFAPVALDFGDATVGAAPLALTHSDAGRIRVHARLVLPDGSGGPSGETMSGASNAFVVRPFGFDVDFAGDRAANGTAGVSYAADAGGSVFRRAGETFTATVTAVGWQDADDAADRDGRPDPGADLTDNPSLASFGSESTAPAVSLSRSLVAPAGGDPGTLTVTGGAVKGFVAGAASADLTWSEVGIVDLTAKLDDYLGSGEPVTGTVAGVGRFIPARLVVADNAPRLANGPDAAWTCGFTYLDQPFHLDPEPALTVRALGLDGGPTRNYGGAFWKLGPAPYLAGRSFADDSGAGAALGVAGAGTASDDGTAADLDGTAVITVHGATLAYARPAAPLGPFDAAVTLTVPGADLVDADGVCHAEAAAKCRTTEGDVSEGHSMAMPAGDVSLRFGRLRLANAAGSERLPVTLPATAEYHDGSGFTANAADSCSSVGGANVDLANDLADPAPGTLTIAVGAGTTTAAFVPASPVTLGDASLRFSAPGAGNTGYADSRLDLAATPWLRFDWDGDGNHDDDPAGRVTFGIFQGSEVVIQIREPWN